MKNRWTTSLAVCCVLALAGCEVSVEQLPANAQDAQDTDGTPVGARIARSAPSDPAPQVPAARPAPGPTSAMSPPRAVAKGNLQFVEGYQRGYEQALREGKPMLVFFTAEWCHYCHELAREAFVNQQVMGLAQRFVCILVDADDEPGVCRQFRIQGFPTIQFISPRGVPLNRLVGKKPSHQVLMAMQAALQNVAQRERPAGDSVVK